MEPKIKKQKKVLINQGLAEPTSFSRLEATAIAEIPTTVNSTFEFLIKYFMNSYNSQNELEDWNEDRVGWDDQNTNQLIREARKEIRASKHKPSTVR